MNNLFITIITMKLVFFFTVFFSLGLQAKTSAQTVTLHVKSRPLKAVLDDLTKQTKYRFIYEHGLLDDAWRVTINANDASLDEAMRQVVSGLPLAYSKHDGVILIKSASPTKKATPMAVVAAAQQYVEGHVVNERGNPLAGVSIRVEGTARETATDDNGAFRIQ